MQNQRSRTEPSADTDAKSKFAAEQSRQDRQSAVEYTKAILQLLIGGSGLLSTALVAIIATHKDKPFVQPTNHELMPHVVLLGASVFANAAYLAGGPDVVTQLRQRLPSGWRATLAAVDGSVMAAIPGQLGRVPADARAPSGQPRR